MKPTNQQHSEQASDGFRSCPKVRSFLHRYVEGELDSWRSRMVRSHLAACTRCHDEVEELELERLWLIESALEAPALSPRLVSKIMEPIEQERTSTQARRRRFVLQFVAGVAALALLVPGSVAWWSSSVGPETSSVASSGGPIDAMAVDATVIDATVIDSRMADARMNSAKAIDLKATASDLEKPDLNRRGPVLVAKHERLLQGDSSDSAHRDVSPRNVLVRDDSVGMSHRLAATSFEPASLWYLPAPGKTDERECYLAMSETGFEGSLSGDISGNIYGGDVRRVWFLRVKLNRQVTLPDTVRIAMQLSQKGDRASQVMAEPCATDPNADGKTDIDDVAYGFQVLYGAQELSVTTPEQKAVMDPECDGLCAKA